MSEEKFFYLVFFVNFHYSIDFGVLSISRYGRNKQEKTIKKQT